MDTNSSSNTRDEIGGDENLDVTNLPHVVHDDECFESESPQNVQDFNKKETVSRSSGTENEQQNIEESADNIISSTPNGCESQENYAVSLQSEQIAHERKENKRTQLFMTSFAMTRLRFHGNNFFSAQQE